MDIYKVINESKKNTGFSEEEIDRVFSLSNEQIMYYIIAKYEKEDEYKEERKLAEFILKRKDEYWKAVNDKSISKFTKDFNEDFSVRFEHRKKQKKKLFELIDLTAGTMSGKVETGVSINAIAIKLFLKEYNTKYAFTWKAFKQVKKLYDKTHPVEVNDMSALKRILEKEFKLGDINNTTVFCKTNHTLSNEVLELLKKEANA